MQQASAQPFEIPTSLRFVLYVDIRAYITVQLFKGLVKF